MAKATNSYRMIYTFTALHVQGRGWLRVHILQEMVEVGPSKEQLRTFGTPASPNKECSRFSGLNEGFMYFIVPTVNAGLGRLGLPGIAKLDSPLLF